MEIEEMQEFKDSKLVVGQEVFVAKYNQLSRIYDRGETSVISKVGRKYFEVAGINNGTTPAKYFNDSKLANSEYSGRPKLYPSKDCFEQEILATKARAAVLNQMRGYNALEKLNYDELKAIADILSKKYDFKI